MSRTTRSGFLKRGGVDLRSSPRSYQKLPEVNNYDDDVISINKNNFTLAGFVRVKIYKRDIICKGLLDSGNLFNTLISEELFQGLGLKMNSNESPEVGTANSAQTIEILGRSEPFQIFLEGVRKAFWIQPYVARNVRHPLNLGQDFLGQECVTLNFNQEHNSFTIAGDTTRMITKRQPLLIPNFVDHRFQRVVEKLHNVPILRTSMIYWGNGHTGKEDNWTGVVYSLHDQEVPAHSVSFIDINIPENHRSSQILIEPEFMATRKELPVLTCKGIYPMIGNIGKVAVVNPGPESVKIEAQTRLGQASGGYKIKEKTEKEIGELSHKPMEDLTEEEIKEWRAYIIKHLKI